MRLPQLPETSMDNAQERAREIDATVADIRAIEQREGITRSILANIRQRRIQLAARTGLSTVQDFPPSGPGGKRSSRLYRLAEDCEKHARACLSWEVALVEQIKRDPAIRFRAHG